MDKIVVSLWKLQIREEEILKELREMNRKLTKLTQ